MAWQLQQKSNYGTSTPAVARTFLQDAEILKFFKITDAQRDNALESSLAMKRHLLRCVECCNQVSEAVLKADSALASGELVLDPNSKIFRPPVVPDLEIKAESFLQAAKLAIAEATNITGPILGESFGHRLNQMEKWCIKRYGKKHSLVEFSSSWQPMVKMLLAMRDAVEHPKPGARGRLHIRNFYVHLYAGEANIQIPSWWLEGEKPTAMHIDMLAYIDAILELHESLVGILFEMFKVMPLLMLVEVPNEQRTPSNPARFRVAIPKDLLPPSA